MLTQPTSLHRDSNEYYRLQTACKIFKELTHDMWFDIKDMFYDVGQEHMWTNIIAYKLTDNTSCKPLTKEQWLDIVNSDNETTIREIVTEIIKNDKSVWNLHSNI